jgi:hypothetical protein
MLFIFLRQVTSYCLTQCKMLQQQLPKQTTSRTDLLQKLFLHESTQAPPIVQSDPLCGRELEILVSPGFVSAPPVVWARARALSVLPGARRLGRNRQRRHGAARDAVGRGLRAAARPARREPGDRGDDDAGMGQRRAEVDLLASAGLLRAWRRRRTLGRRRAEVDLLASAGHLLRAGGERRGPARERWPSLL